MLVNLAENTPNHATSPFFSPSFTPSKWNMPQPQNMFTKRKKKTYIESVFNLTVSKSLYPSNGAPDIFVWRRMYWQSVLRKTETFAGSLYTDLMALLSRRQETTLWHSHLFVVERVNVSLIFFLIWFYLHFLHFRFFSSSQYTLLLFLTYLFTSLLILSFLPSFMFPSVIRTSSFFRCHVVPPCQVGSTSVSFPGSRPRTGHTGYPLWDLLWISSVTPASFRYSTSN
jgi:hypothetical protein